MAHESSTGFASNEDLALINHDLADFRKQGLNRKASTPYPSWRLRSVKVIYQPRHIAAKQRFATEVVECHSYFHCTTRLDRTLPLLGKRIIDQWQMGRLEESGADLPLGNFGAPLK